ncbi:MAG: N-acetyl sugar amidotransferase, partial [Candidatus Bathyarchaeota archaeon]|nr:N-acetyl sugar amidotransferase [Candidatus Bathyarchaeota archaeon]
MLDEIVSKINKEGKGKEYDCVMGVSGGVDSSYVTYVVNKLGLRPLAIHLDNGWDSELAVKNIELLLTKLGYDLFTEVLDWEQFRDLQLSFLLASTPDSEIPSDHAIAAILRHKAEEFGIKTVITGTNYRTETHLPLAWSYGARDWRYIRSVHAKFGKTNLNGFPHYDKFQDLIFKARL